MSPMVGLLKLYQEVNDASIKMFIFQKLALSKLFAIHHMLNKMRFQIHEV
jgi:hypothetical protein